MGIKFRILLIISILLVIVNEASYGLTPINPTIVYMFKAPVTEVESIAIHGKYLWVATNKGMFRLDPNNGTIIKQVNINAAGLVFVGDYLYAIKITIEYKLNNTGVVRSIALSDHYGSTPVPQVLLAASQGHAHALKDAQAICSGTSSLSPMRTEGHTSSLIPAYPPLLKARSE